VCRIPSHRTAIKANSTGIWESRLRLYPQAFLDMRLAFPPLEEQLEIVRHLDSRTQQWDALISDASRAIELLKERRTALISAAVTGQIDVRHVEELQPA
jgi:type I restriction enzyme, S subunit